MLPCLTDGSVASTFGKNKTFWSPRFLRTAEALDPGTGETTKRSDPLPSFITLSANVAMTCVPLTTTEGQPGQVPVPQRDETQVPGVHSESMVQAWLELLEQVPQSPGLVQARLELLTQSWQSEALAQDRAGLLEQTFGPVRTAKEARRIPKLPQASSAMVQSALVVHGELPLLRQKKPWPPMLADTRSARQIGLFTPQTGFTVLQVPKRVLCPPTETTWMKEAS